MRKSLSEIVRKYSLGAGLAGALAAGGCTFSDMMITDGIDRKDGITLGAGLLLDEYDREKQGEHEIEVAEAGRSQININVGNNAEAQNNTEKQSYVQEEDKDFIFTFSTYEGNPSEGYEIKKFKGLKRDFFRTTEPVGFCLYNMSKRGDVRIVLKLNDQQFSDQTIKDGLKGSVHSKRINPNLSESGNLPAGKYTGEWYRDGVFLGKSEAEVK